MARANLTGEPSAAKKALVAEMRASVEAVRLLHQLAKTRGAPNGVSALALVVEALPPQVRAARRLNPILPVVKRLPEVKVGGGSPEREAGQRVLGLVPLDHRRGQLPLFGPSAEGPRVALLEMADRAGMVTMAKGRGAPLALRLPVFAMLDLPPEHRHDTARVVLKVRELREDLFPGRKDGARQWPRIREALFRLQNLTVPMEGEARWFPFALRQEPGDRPGLEDEVVIDLALPPGAGNGPPIDREVLRRLGVQSGPRFRALLAVHSVQWRPGRTRVPVPGCRRPYRVWAANPDAYVILTAQDRRRLAFGEDSRKHRTTGEQEAPWEDLPGVEVVSKDARDSATGREGWLVVPTEAARAIKGRGNRERSIAGEREVDNRGARGGQPGSKGWITGELTNS